MVVVHDERYPDICHACGTQYYPMLGDNCPKCDHDNDHETRLLWLRARHDEFKRAKVYGVKCIFCDKPVNGFGMRFDGNYAHSQCLNIDYELFKKKIGVRGEWVR